jgi:protein TonB
MPNVMRRYNIAFHRSSPAPAVSGVSLRLNVAPAAERSAARRALHADAQRVGMALAGSLAAHALVAVLVIVSAVEAPAPAELPPAMDIVFEPAPALPTEAAAPTSAATSSAVPPAAPVPDNQPVPVADPGPASNEPVASVPPMASQPQPAPAPPAGLAPAALPQPFASIPWASPPAASLPPAAPVLLAAPILAPVLPAPEPAANRTVAAANTLPPARPRATVRAAAKSPNAARHAATTPDVPHPEPAAEAGKPSASATPAPPQSTPSAPGQARSPINPSWTRAIGAWLQEHKTYPEAARRRSEEGQAQVRFTVDRDGHVLDFTLVHGTGSSRLDAAVADLLRGARLPGFPADMTEPQATVVVTLRYALEP